MFDFSACIEMLFSYLPFAERPARAKAAGFDAVEFWLWTDHDLPAIEDSLAQAHIPCRICIADTADPLAKRALAQGGLLTNENAPVFAQAVAESLERTAALGVRSLIVTPGKTLPDIPISQQQDALARCLSEGGKAAARYGARLLLEPINPQERPGGFLSRSAQALEILRAVNRPNVRLLYDVYHQQITEGNLTQSLCNDIAQIGHIHIADVPGRHEPGTGEIQYANVLRQAAAAGYEGSVGFEFRPSDEHRAWEIALDALAMAKHAVKTV